MGEAAAMSYLLAVFLGVIALVNAYLLTGEEMTTVQQPVPTKADAPATSPRWRQAGRRRRLKRTNPLFWVVLVLLALIFITPLLYMLLTSIKTNVEARSVPPTLFPSEPTLEAFRTLFFTDEASPVLLWLANSMISATLHSLLVLVVCSLAGYAFARMEFPLKNLLFGLIIATLFLPPFIFMMPNFEILNRLGWLDTLLAIIVPGAASAFGVFFMRQFFSTIPIALEESARIDGAGPWRTFFSIVLPNARAATGHPGGDLVPGQLERLHLPDLRAVLARAAHPAGRADQAAGRVRHRLPGDHGRRGDGLDPGAAALHLRAALRHRGSGEQRHQGLTSWSTIAWTAGWAAGSKSGMDRKPWMASGKTRVVTGTPAACSTAA